MGGEWPARTEEWASGDGRTRAGIATATGNPSRRRTRTGARKNTERAMRAIGKTLAGIAMLVASGTGLAAGVLSPFTAVYQVNREDMPIGHGQFTLRPAGDNCYSYQQSLNPEGIASLLAGRVNADSRFCVVG